MTSKTPERNQAGGSAVTGSSAPATSRTSTLACNGCTVCCKNDLIVLHPEYGDDPAKYKTVLFTDPMSGAKKPVLDKKPNGDCIYLGPGGCTIYENRPAICRSYDCRRQYMLFTREEKKRMVQIGVATPQHFVEGKKRAHTLTGAERLEVIAARKARSA